MTRAQQPTLSQTWIALLGRRDGPTDGVEDYCACLGQALAHHDLDLELVRIRMEKGWLGALLRIRRMSSRWRGNWVLLQYTALGWSRRGFPLGAIAAVLLLRSRRIRCGVVFHESFRQGEPTGSLKDSIRGAFQNWVIHTVHRFSSASIFTLPLDRIQWLQKGKDKSVFIPVGPNRPEGVAQSEVPHPRSGTATVAVFCVSDPPFREREIDEISCAIRSAATAGRAIRIVFVGKGTREAQSDITRAFEGMPVEVINRGLCELSVVSRLLADSDAMLCVRGKLDLRRASALMGIAAGVPILAYSGAAEGTPLMDAGIEFVNYRDCKALGTALMRVLTDGEHWLALRAKNLTVHRQYFSWELIASKFVHALIDERAPE